MHRLGQYLLANPIRAMIAALFCALLPLISIPGGFIAAILVGFVTLCQGYKSGFLVLAGVTVPTIGLAVWDHVVLFDFVLLRCLLVYGLAIILRQYGSWRLTLEIITLLGVITVLIFHLVIGDVPAWWLDTLGHYKEELSSLTGGQLSEDKIQQFLNQIAPMATGLFTTLIFFGVICQLLIARWWQATLFNPKGLAKEFVEIRMAVWLVFFYTIVLIAKFVGLELANDLLPTLMFPFVIVGLSLLHYWARYKKEIVFLLVVVYLSLIFLPLVVLVFLALAGYVDSWYDLRKRYHKRSSAS